MGLGSEEWCTTEESSHLLLALLRLSKRQCKKEIHGTTTKHTGWIHVQRMSKVKWSRQLRGWAYKKYGEPRTSFL